VRRLEREDSNTPLSKTAVGLAAAVRFVSARLPAASSMTAASPAAASPASSPAALNFQQDAMQRTNSARDRLDDEIVAMQMEEEYPSFITTVNQRHQHKTYPEAPEDISITFAAHPALDYRTDSYIPQLSTYMSVEPRFMVEPVVRSDKIRSYVVAVHIARTTQDMEMAKKLTPQMAFLCVDGGLDDVCRAIIGQLIGCDVWASNRDLGGAQPPWQTQQCGVHHYVTLHETSAFEEPADRNASILEWMLMYIVHGGVDKRPFVADIITQVLADGLFMPWFEHHVSHHPGSDDRHDQFEFMLRFLLRAMMDADNPINPNTFAKEVPLLYPNFTHVADYRDTESWEKVLSILERVRHGDDARPDPIQDKDAEVVRRRKCDEENVSWEATGNGHNHIDRPGTLTRKLIRDARMNVCLH
jgi:hypothetical protein